MTAGTITPVARDIPWFNRPVLRRAAWFLLAVLALVMRLPGLGKSIWLDEAFTLQEVYAPDFMQAVRSSDHPFLYSFILRGWASFGEGEAFLRIPSVIFGVATVLVLVWVVTSVSRPAALLVGSMAALSPTLLRFSQEIRDYSLLLLFTSLAFYFANRSIRRVEPSPLIGLAVSLSGAVMSHLAGIFLVPALAGYLACHAAQFKRRDLLPLAGALLSPVLIFTLYYLFVLSPQVRGRTGAQWGEGALSPELLVFAFLYLIGFFSWLNPLPAASPALGAIPVTPASALMLACLLVLITSLLLGGWRKSWPYLLAAGLYWGGMLVYSILFVVIINERAIVPGLVPLLCFVAMQVTSIEKKAMRYLTYAMIGVLCLSAALNWLTFSALIPQENWRGLGESLAAAYQPGDRVVVFPSYAAAAISVYAPQAAADGLIGVPVGVQDSAPAAEVLRELKGAGRVFLVYRADARSVNDPQTLQTLRAELLRLYGHEQEQQWDRLILYRYQP